MHTPHRYIRNFLSPLITKSSFLTHSLHFPHPFTFQSTDSLHFAQTSQTHSFESSNQSNLLYPHSQAFSLYFGPLLPTCFCSSSLLPIFLPTSQDPPQGHPLSMHNMAKYVNHDQFLTEFNLAHTFLLALLLHGHLAYRLC